MQKTILLVDDDTAMRQLFGIAFERAGFNILQAPSGEHALSILEHETPDAFILDVMMPGMNGFELCRYIRSQPQFVTQPIIMLSSAFNDELVEEGMAAGASDYLCKVNTPLFDLVAKFKVLLMKQTVDEATHGT